MDPAAILLALEEQSRWRERRRRLEERLEILRAERQRLLQGPRAGGEGEGWEAPFGAPGRGTAPGEGPRAPGLGAGLAALGRLGEEEARLLKELGQIDQQIAYYASLARDMKMSVEPPRLARLLRSLRRG